MRAIDDTTVLCIFKAVVWWIGGRVDAVRTMLPRSSRSYCHVWLTWMDLR